MTYRPPPGEQLGAGRIRVDAARAIAKLREYQLADRHAWILECIRAAVAGGATAIELTGDADDVWLTWIGTPLAVEDLPRLFDELVSPEAEESRHHVRLLAAGVNSALGLGDDDLVDVYATTADGIWRVRYTGEVMTEEALRALAAAPVGAPARQLVDLHLRGRTGMVVHLHRAASLAVFARFLRGAEPPELALARAACRDLAVPLAIGNTILPRTEDGRDVVRLPLGEGLDGFIAIGDLDPSTEAWHPVVELAERGVVLARESMTIVENPQRQMPLRVFVDSPRLPTDASRSQVRRDAYPVPQALARAVALVPALIDALIAKAATDPRARAAALALLASTGASWQQPPALFGRLGEAPLLRDATGRPRAASAPWVGVVVRGKQPLEAALAPWVDGMLWIAPGDPAELLAIASDARTSSRFLRTARRQRRAHDAFFEHAPREPKVNARGEPRIRMPIATGLDASTLDAALFANLSGEICVYAPGSGHAGGELVVLWQGRELERIGFDTQLAFDAIIDSPDLRAGERYRAVLHDIEYLRVVKAMRAAVYRAVEIVADVGQGHAAPRGVVLAGDDPVTDAELVRRALALGQTLDTPLRGPLATYLAWPTSTGGWSSTAGLASAKAIGVVAADLALAPPRGRTVVRAATADRELLERLIASPRVSYHAEHTGTTGAELAAPYLDGLGCALIVEAGDGELAVIAPALDPRLVLRHRGARITRTAYKPRFIPVTIELDSDAIVPNEAWSDVRDDGGIHDRDFAMYEAQFVRAVFAALAGSRPPELVGDAPIEIASPVAIAACEALAHHAKRIALPDPLAARLRAIPLVRLLGETELRTLDELDARFPKQLTFVGQAAVPAPGFVAIVAHASVARACGVLLDRAVHDVTAALESARAALEAKARIAKHRERPVVPLALADAPTVELANQVVTRGLIGLSRGGSEIQVLVEGRPFDVLRYPGGFAVNAVVDVGVDRVDEAFERLPTDVIDAIVVAIGQRVPELLVTIGEVTPAALGHGPAFALLRAWVEAKGAITKDVRHALCVVETFRTIQGELVSLERAGEPRRVISTAQWETEWLGPGEGESPAALDGPVIRVGAPGLVAVIERLHVGSVVDVTSEVSKLQGRRRMARGLIPAPTLSAIPAWRKCKLGELGDLGKKLGLGEIGLADGDASMAYVHVRGELVKKLPLDVVPAVHVALESEELAEAAGSVLGASQLRALGLLDKEPREIDDQVQELAVRLIRKLLPVMQVDALTVPMRRGLGRLALTRRIEPHELAGVPCFELEDGRWTDGKTLIDQLAKHGNAWSVPTSISVVGLTPLDDTRRVFVVTPEDRAIAVAHDLQLIDAVKELQLDARARKNRARAPQPLTLPTPVIARAELPGDGTTVARGSIGLLGESHEARAGIRPFRNGLPFDVMQSGCAWPTIAVVEDARFVPDRTWDRVLEDETWHAMQVRVREASAELVDKLGIAPADALISLRITPEITRTLIVPPDSPLLVIAGTCWLAPQLGTGQHVTVSGAPGFTGFDDGTPISAQLFTHGAIGPDLQRAVTDLAALVHGRLVRGLLERPADELTTYHAALALALHRVVPREVTLTFPCFSPRPIGAAELVTVLTGKDYLDVIDRPDPSRTSLALVTDGSHLSRLIRARLGKRARVPTLTMPAVLPSPTAIYVPPLPKPAPAAKPKAHPLQPLATLLENRLAAIGLAQPTIAIVPARGDLVFFDGELCIGEHPQLTALLAMHRARHPHAGDALDALAAHAVTVLNVALTSVTDASETAALARLLGAR